MSRNDTKGGFIQFPLCTLAAPWPFEKIMSRCVGYAAVNFANSLDDTEYFDDEAKLHHARRTLGFTCADISVLDEDFQLVSDFHESFALQEHATAYVRLPIDYAIEMLRREWSENESRVFIAISSAIGQKLYARLGWEIIALRAAGLLKLGLNIQSILLTRAQVDYAAARLTSRELLARYTFNRGRRFWSFPAKCSREQVARFVLTKHLKKKHLLGESDSALTARLTRELKEDSL